MKFKFFRGRRRKLGSEMTQSKKFYLQPQYTSHYGGSYDATFKIVLFGDIVEGREQLIEKSLSSLFVSDSKMTIGVDFEVKSLDVDQNRVKLQVWDFNGEERFKFLLPTYVRGSKGALFIYNVNDESSLKSLDNWLSLIKKKMKEDENFPILVVGLNTEEEEKKEVPIKEAIEIAKKKDIHGFIECSVKTGENVEKAFENLTRLMLQKGSY